MFMDLYGPDFQSQGQGMNCKQDFIRLLLALT